MAGNRARAPPKKAPLSGALMALVCVLCSGRAPVADAGWIDPDTPPEAHTTWALPANPPPVPKGSKRKPGESSKNCTALAGTNRTKCTTNSTKANATRHTPAPTTQTPTAMPTEKPTPREYKLVMSDEFNVPGRKFADGADPKWTAMHKNDYTNDAQHFYHNDNAYTEDGELVIETAAKDTEIIGFDDVNLKKTHVTKHFRSAMLQSWNKFCFTGGIAEAEVVMPGKHDIGGLWPAFWLLGNLARHTYVGSSEHVWPWSVTGCTEKSFDAQLISGCAKSVHWGMEPGVGRGSPEIDIFEVQPGNIGPNTGQFKMTYVGQPFMSASYQVAPGIPYARPGSGWWPAPGQWYDGLVGGNRSALNILFYGAYNHFLSDTDPARQDYWSDAISFNRQLDAEHFERKHRYRLEWEVPDPENGHDGYLHWFLNDQLVLKINGTGIVEKGLGSGISSEPSYILLNTAVSSQWGFPTKCPTNCPCKTYNCRSTDWKDKCGFTKGFCDMLKNESAKYKINYVRVWQDPDDPKQKVGCSTPERPTRKWIEAHHDLYKQEGDAAPLKGVQRGGGFCSDGGGGGDDNGGCGGPKRGTCTSGNVCECRQGWTGPNCLAHAGRDDVLWDEPDSLADVGFQPPSYFPRALIIGLAACAVVLVVAFILTRRRRGKGYVIVPNVEKAGGQFA